MSSDTRPLVEYGTSSSGNWGHEGRPGERGGSEGAATGGSSELRSFLMYRMVRTPSLSDVQREGLKLGEKSHMGRPPSIYMCDTRALADLYVKGSKSIGIEGDAYIISIRIPESAFDDVLEDEWDRHYLPGASGGLGYAYRMERSIPPEWIAGIEKVEEAARRPGREAKSKTMYAVVFVAPPQELDAPPVFSEYGAVTSGNWGHEGRPGERGGSKSGGGLGQLSFENHEDARVVSDRAWETRLSEDEEEAIQIYTGAGYYAVNRQLRNGEPIDEWNRGWVRKLDEALVRTSAPRTLLVSRGVCSEPECKEKFGNLRPGDRFSDPAFVSATVVQGSGFPQDVRMRVLVREGDPGAYVANFSSHPSEGEYLFPRDTTFKVIKVEEEHNRFWDTRRTVVTVVVDRP